MPMIFIWSRTIVMSRQLGEHEFTLQAYPGRLNRLVRFWLDCL